MTDQSMEDLCAAARLLAHIESRYEVRASLSLVSLGQLKVCMHHPESDLTLNVVYSVYQFAQADNLWDADRMLESQARRLQEGVERERNAKTEQSIEEMRQWLEKQGLSRTNHTAG